MNIAMPADEDLEDPRLDPPEPPEVDVGIPEVWSVADIDEALAAAGLDEMDDEAAVRA
jgi:hypothetical protein